MRKSSKINDVAMEKIIPWVSKGLTEKELNAKMREIYKELGLSLIHIYRVLSNSNCISSTGS